MKYFLLVEVTLLLLCATAFGIGDTITLTVDPCAPCAYSTVQAAVNAVPDNSLDGYVIEIAPGDYHELVDVGINKQFLTIRGTGADPCDTYIYWATEENRRGVLRLYGYNIRCENLTVENTTPINTIQAEAFETFGDKASMENCRFVSYQDTIRCQGSGTKRSYYHDCYIAGRTDFIWHKGIALFEDCNIMSTYSNTGGYITAAGTPWEQRWGFIFKNCNLLNDNGGDDVALGRPWREGAMTSYLNCWMDSHIRSSGWKDWDARIYQSLVRYSEYNSTGPGANPTGRVRNTIQLTDEQAAEFTRENILAGWNPYITAMPTIWNSTTGYWDESAKWENGLPTSGTNAYIPNGCNVTVRQSGAQASTLTLDGSAMLYIDGNTGGSLTVDELANRSTTAEVHIINNGQFNPFAYTGFAEPAGKLFVDQGTFHCVNVRIADITLAASGSDYATVTINDGDDWYVERIQMGSGTSIVNINGGILWTKEGLNFGNTGTPTLKVTGGDAEINIAGYYQQGANGTLAAENEGGSISTINVSGNVTFASGAKLLLETAWGVPAAQYTLMKWTGTRTGELMLDASVDPNEWSFILNDSNKELVVTYTPQNRVNFVDMAGLADKWMEDYWEWDLDESGNIDINDLDIFINKWLLGK